MNLDLPSPAPALLEQPLDGAYPGGKGVDGLYQWIISKMPTHAVYVEPFAGRGAIARRKPPALYLILLDLDSRVIDWWARLRWPGTRAVLADGIRWLRRHGRDLQADTLVYCDPPYPRTTRTKKRIYRFEMTDRAHLRFLEGALNASCPLMVSSYPSAMYDDALGSWHRFTHRAITRGGVERTEVLWTNFDPAAVSPALASAYHALGKNFRERERVARKIKRWTSRLLAAPPIERRALVLAIYDAVGASIAASGGGDRLPLFDDARSTRRKG